MKRKEKIQITEELEKAYLQFEKKPTKKNKKNWFELIKKWRDVKWN